QAGMTMTQEYSSADVRIEHDSMGTVEVPQQALWRAQTERARHNFQFSSLRFPRVFIQALAHIKAAAAATNAAAGVLTTQQADAIIAAADHILTGAVDDAFPLDIFQTGSGTSTNMNKKVRTITRTLVTSQTHLQPIDC